MSYAWRSPARRFDKNVMDMFWYQLVPWIYGKLFSLGWTFISSMASYSPFLLMTLIENKLDENRWKDMQQRQMRAREDYAIEELSAYKEGDEQDQYIKPVEKKKETEENEEEEVEEDEE